MAKTDRPGRLLALCAARGLDGFLVSSLPSIRYLSGFTGSSAACLVTGAGCFFFTDFRYELQAGREVKGFTIERVAEGGLFAAVAQKAVGTGCARLGFDAEAVTYAKYRRLEDALQGGCRCVAAPRLVENLRMVKDRKESLLLARLARMADGVLAACRESITPDSTERGIARLIEGLGREAGADGLSFPSIVASGNSSAMPHYRPGRGRVHARGPLLVDFGLSLDGYSSDLTRTFHLGRVARRYREIYAAVLEAQHVAIKMIRPGVKAGDVDRAARGYISAAGYGDCFGHGLGHGIGLEVHEQPRIGPGAADVLEEGMIFTVEPGIYIPGWGGVRIEDMVLVGKNGCRVLTSSAKAIGDSVL